MASVEGDARKGREEKKKNAASLSLKRARTDTPTPSDRFFVVSIVLDH